MKNKVTIVLSLALVMVLLGVRYAVAQAKTALPGTRDPFDVTFTKWITEFPQMTCVVGGAIGPGTFEGQILDPKVEGNVEYVEAIYHINGGKHPFTAHLYASQDDSLGGGVITGGVTDGWLKGASLTGEYDMFAQCPIETPGNGMDTLCFQGVLHLRPGNEAAK